MLGVKGAAPPVNTIVIYDIMQSIVLSFTGILMISIVDYFWLTRTFNGEFLPVALLVGSFGASAVLTFDAYKSPLAQPRNLVGGHVCSAFTGVVVHTFGQATYMSLWIQGPLAVSLAIGMMRLCKTVHPPGTCVYKHVYVCVCVCVCVCV